MYYSTVFLKTSYSQNACCVIHLSTPSTGRHVFSILKEISNFKFLTGHQNPLCLCFGQLGGSPGCCHCAKMADGRDQEKGPKDSADNSCASAVAATYTEEQVVRSLELSPASSSSEDDFLCLRESRNQDLLILAGR